MYQSTLRHQMGEEPTFSSHINPALLSSISFFTDYKLKKKTLSHTFLVIVMKMVSAETFMETSVVGEESHSRVAIYACLGDTGWFFRWLRTCVQIWYLTIISDTCRESLFILKSSLEKLKLGKAILSLVKYKTGNKGSNLCSKVRELGFAAVALESLKV